MSSRHTTLDTWHIITSLFSQYKLALFLFDQSKLNRTMAKLKVAINTTQQKQREVRVGEVSTHVFAKYLSLKKETKQVF